MLLAAALLQLSVAAPVFAPPVDAPLRVVTERTETSRDERRYRLERLVRFGKENTGYRAEVVVLAITPESSQALGDLVGRGLSGLAHRKIVLHLDSEGQTVTIEDMPALWEIVCQRIADAAATRPGEAAKFAASLAASVRALPPERQRALLATLVTAVISTEPLEPVGTSATVKLPGGSPFGAPMILEGTRRTVAAENGLLRTITVASAKIPLPARNGTVSVPVGISLERIRTFDPQTGMIASGLDTTRNTVESGAAPRQTLLVTSIRVERAAPSDWPD